MKCRYMFLFPLNNLACKGLRSFVLGKIIVTQILHLVGPVDNHASPLAVIYVTSALILDMRSVRLSDALGNNLTWAWPGRLKMECAALKPKFRKFLKVA